MKQACLALATGLALMAGSAACSQDSSPASPTPPPSPAASLTLKSISPPLGTVLPHGQVTNFQATLTYSLGTASFGNVAVATASAAPVLLVIPGPVQQLGSPAGDATLVFPLNIPNTAAGATLQMSFSLFATGASTSSARFVETYKVAR